MEGDGENWDDLSRWGFKNGKHVPDSPNAEKQPQQQQQQSASNKAEDLVDASTNASGTGGFQEKKWYSSLFDFQRPETPPPPQQQQAPTVEDDEEDLNDLSRWGFKNGKSVLDLPNADKQPQKQRRYSADISTITANMEDPKKGGLYASLFGFRRSGPQEQKQQQQQQEKSDVPSDCAQSLATAADTEVPDSKFDHENVRSVKTNTLDQDAAPAARPINPVSSYLEDQPSPTLTVASTPSVIRPDATSLEPDHSPSAEQQGLTITVQEPPADGQEPAPQSGFSWSSHEGGEDADDEGELDEDEPGENDSDEECADYEYDSYPQPAGEGQITAETPVPVEQPKARGRQQERSTITESHSSGLRSVSPGIYQRYPAEVFSPNALTERTPVERPAGEALYDGPVAPATGGCSSDEDTVYRPRSNVLRGLGATTYWHSKDEKEPGLSETLETYQDRKARYRAAGKGQPIYRSWAQSVQNASSPPTSPPDVRNNTAALLAAQAEKEVSPPQSSTSTPPSSPPTPPPTSAPDANINAAAFLQALAEEDDDEDWFQGHMSDEASRRSSLAGIDAEDTDLSYNLQVRDADTVTGEHTSTDDLATDSANAAASQAEGTNNRTHDVASSDEISTQDEWNDSSSGSEDSNEPYDGPDESAGIIESDTARWSAPETAASSDDLPEASDDWLGAREEGTSAHDEGQEGRLFAPLTSGVTLERSSTSHGPDSNTQEGERPSTPPMQQPISPTSPDKRGREPLTGLTAAEGLDAFNEYRRNARQRHPSEESMSYLQKQRLSLKAKSPGNRQVDAIEAYQHNKAGNKPEHRIKELEGMIEHFKVNMLKYRWERNAMIDVEEVLTDRVGRLDRRNQALHNEIQDINREWANALENERQGRAADNEANSIHRAQWEKERLELQNMVTESVTAAEQLTRDLEQSDLKRQEWKAKCKELSEKSKAQDQDIKQWKAFAESNEESATAWRQSQDATTENKSTQTAHTHAGLPAEILLQASPPATTVPTNESDVETAQISQPTNEVEVVFETSPPRSPPTKEADIFQTNAEDEENLYDASPPSATIRERAERQLSVPDSLAASQPPASEDLVWPLAERALVTEHLADWINKNSKDGSSLFPITQETINELLGDGRTSYEQLVTALVERDNRYLVNSQEMARSLYDQGMIEAGALPDPHDTIVRAGEGLEGTGNTALELVQCLRDTEYDLQTQAEELTAEADARQHTDVELQDCQRHGEQLQAALDEAERHKKELEDTVEELVAKLDEQSAESAELGEQVQHSTQQVDQLEARLEKEEARIAELTQANETVGTEPLERRQSMAGFEGLKQVQEAAQKKAAENDAPSSDNLTKRYASLKVEYDALRKAHTDLRAELEELRADDDDVATETQETFLSLEPPTPDFPFSPASLLNNNKYTRTTNNGYPRAMPTSDVTRTPHIGPAPAPLLETEPRRWAERMFILRKTPEYVEDERRRRVAREAQQAFEKNRFDAIEREIEKHIGRELEYIPKEKRWANLKL